MKFKTWLENNIEDAQTAFPASAEVLRTGMQPQVDGQEINTKQKEEHDQLLGIDGHIQRIKSSINGMNVNSKKLKRIQHFLKNFLDKWEEIKTDDSIPKNNLSLSQNQLSPGIGTLQQPVINQ